MKALNLILLAFILATQAMSGAYADLLLSLPDAMLFDLALQQKVGQCFIGTCGLTASCACDLYAKMRVSPTVVNGLPDNYGSGCVVAPDYPRGMNVCWGPPNTYPSYNGTATPICTNSGKTNAANMIRIGIKKGYCQIPSC